MHIWIYQSVQEYMVQIRQSIEIHSAQTYSRYYVPIVHKLYIRSQMLVFIVTASSYRSTRVDHYSDEIGRTDRLQG